MICRTVPSSDNVRFDLVKLACHVAVRVEHVHVEAAIGVKFCRLTPPL